MAVQLLIEIFVRLLWSQSLACPFAPERPLAAALVFPPRRLLPDMAFSGALVCSSWCCGMLESRVGTESGVVADVDGPE